jgi:transposase, IS6 family
MSGPTPTAPPLDAELQRLLRRMRLPHIRRVAPEVLATAKPNAGIPPKSSKHCWPRKSPGGTAPRWPPGGLGRPFPPARPSTPGTRLSPLSHRPPSRRCAPWNGCTAIDVLVSEKRDLAATRRFFTRALEHGPSPTEVNTDRAPAYPRVLDELLSAACHIVEQYATNPIEADHRWLEARLRPMRGLKRMRSTRVISAGHAFVQNLRRGHYELGVDVGLRHRLTAVFTELARAI